MIDEPQTNIDIKRSKKIAKRIRAKSKQCFSNALLALDLEELAEARYVEGFACGADGYILEHGWIEHAGAIIDPTVPGQLVMYLPWLRFTRADLYKTISTALIKELPLMHFSTGKGEYRQAYFEADSIAKALGQAQE